ncbi:hypothetical protein [Maribacter sp. 2307ULW6-5]|uniref:hypothetical protein n=1 Tax=Maribacter sp. 2307ULW6-5 TaxID=3386275 RepID=UPI0039BD14BB
MALIVIPFLLLGVPRTFRDVSEQPEHQGSGQKKVAFCQLHFPPFFWWGNDMLAWAGVVVWKKPMRLSIAKN